MTQANYSLRLQAGLKAEAERVAKAEGTTLNQFINVAVAEKLSALRTVEYFRERAARVDLAGAEALLESFGTAEPPRKGDAPTSPRGRRTRSPASSKTGSGQRRAR